MKRDEDTAPQHAEKEEIKATLKAKQQGKENDEIDQAVSARIEKDKKESTCGTVDVAAIRAAVIQETPRILCTRVFPREKERLGTRGLGWD